MWTTSGKGEWWRLGQIGDAGGGYARLGTPEAARCWVTPAPPMSAWLTSACPFYGEFQYFVLHNLSYFFSSSCLNSFFDRRVTFARPNSWFELFCKYSLSTLFPLDTIMFPYHATICIDGREPEWDPVCRDGCKGVEGNRDDEGVYERFRARAPQRRSQRPPPERFRAPAP